MSYNPAIVSSLIFCAIAVLATFAIWRRKSLGCGRLSENDLVFNGFIKQYEKRVLAFLIEKEAARQSFDREKVLALREEYGTELVMPAYDAHEQLGKCGINPVEVTRLQKAWIIRNGGKPNAHHSTCEVERILTERNKGKAVSLCSFYPCADKQVLFKN